jgi:hypothetical protein
MTKEQLEKAGWVRVSARKMGCMKICKWHDTKTGSIVSQAEAVLWQRERNAAARLGRRVEKEEQRLMA